MHLFPRLDIADRQLIVPIRCNFVGDPNDHALPDQLIQGNRIDGISVFGKMNRRIHMGAAMLCGAEVIRRVIETFIGAAFEYGGFLEGVGSRPVNRVFGKLMGEIDPLPDQLGTWPGRTRGGKKTITAVSTYSCIGSKSAHRVITLPCAAMEEKRIRTLESSHLRFGRPWGGYSTLSPFPGYHFGDGG